jgi:hypothetical protein
MSAIIAIALNFALLAALIFEYPAHSPGGIAFLVVVGALYAAGQRLRPREHVPTAYTST